MSVNDTRVTVARAALVRSTELKSMSLRLTMEAETLSLLIADDDCHQDDMLSVVTNLCALIPSLARHVTGGGEEDAVFLAIVTIGYAQNALLIGARQGRRSWRRSAVEGAIRHMGNVAAFAEEWK